MTDPKQEAHGDEEADGRRKNADELPDGSASDTEESTTPDGGDPDQFQG